MKCSPEWEGVSPKGDHGTKYKEKPWYHMTPYRIQALFRWPIAYPDLKPKPQDPVIPVVVGITDNWKPHEKRSSSGAKVYVQIAHVEPFLRDAVLARVAGLLSEEDVDRCDWVHVEYQEKEGSVAASSPSQPPLHPWGMPTNPCWLKKEQKDCLESLGLAPSWDRQDLTNQVQMLQGALSHLDEKGVPLGSWPRAFVFRECARVAKSMAAGHEGSLQAALQKAVDPGAELITAMTNVMSVPSKDLGDNINSLAPPGMSQLSIQNRVEQASPPEAPPRRGRTPSI